MNLRLKPARLAWIGLTLTLAACGDSSNSGGGTAGSSTGGGGNGTGGNGTGGNATGGNATGGNGTGGNATGGGGSSTNPDGSVCADATECESGNCIDGVCCNEPCDGFCESCLGAETAEPDGSCALVTAGTDPADECEQEGCSAGTCDGMGSCGFASSATECRPAVSVCDMPEFCTGDSPDCGSDVVAPNTTTCGDYECDGASPVCPVSCASDLDCSLDRMCLAGVCVPGRRIFISSTTQNGNLGGLVGADNLCQQLANAAGIFITYQAFMSDSTVSAASRLTESTVPYRLADGTIVADNWADLVDGTLDNNIMLTELGTIPTSVSVMTGTSELGALETMGTTNCNNWQSSDLAQSSVVGSADGVEWASIGTGSCFGNRRIYCVQQ